MKQLKKLAVVVLSKEQQKKIGGAVSLTDMGTCTCPDGTVVDAPGSNPPIYICELACSCRC